MKWTWDKFGIRVTRPAVDRSPVERNPNMERNPNVILDCLQLTRTPGVCVHFYESIGRAIVTVDTTDHNVILDDTRLASRESGWDVDVYTAASVDQMRQRAISHFTSIDAINLELARVLIDHGYLTFDDLSVIAPDTLMHLGGLDTQSVNAIIEQAEVKAEQTNA